MLTQEVLSYLAMFFKTDPGLFNEMMRIRVGLIVELLVSEFGRVIGESFTLFCFYVTKSDERLLLLKCCASLFACTMLINKCTYTWHTRANCNAEWISAAKGRTLTLTLLLKYFGFRLFERIFCRSFDRLESLPNQVVALLYTER